jgi:O-acetylhomoserine aminocarboxypropyltransferase/cysteine synthase
MSNYNINTICVQGGYEPKNGEPRVVPIVQSTTFKYESSKQMGDLFDLKDTGYFYTRLANPTNDAVARKICQLEGGVAAILTSSGQAANFYAILNIAGAGDHIIASSAIYGGTYNLLANTMKNMGIEATFVDPDISAEELESKFKPNTKLVFGETIANPSLKILDIEKFAEVAHKNGVPLIVDNTFPTPIFCRPFEWGVDIVTHSTTKYMNGSANAVGGAVVDSGNFDWEKYSEKFPGLTTPDATYHGIVYTKSFGKGAYITKMTTNLMRDLGAITSPQNSFYLGVGLETLHLRMERHFENALAVAKHLENHPKISWVSFSGLENDSQYALAQKYLPNGTCGVISFGVVGGREAAVKFMDSLKLAAIVTHVADARTCVLHPASTTHRQMNDNELAAAGVSPDLIRMSVGIEDIRDIIVDVDQALYG